MAIVHPVLTEPLGVAGRWSTGIPFICVKALRSAYQVEPAMTPELNAIAATSNLYDTDFYAWTQEQAKLLSQGAWERLDIPNLVEEIESLGKQQRQELRNRLGVLIGHLLKWEFQPDYRSKSWLATIREQRRRVLEILKDNPSLKPYLLEAIEKAYEDGIDLAVRETTLDFDRFPNLCPYTAEQILEADFLPGSEQE